MLALVPAIAPTAWSGQDCQIEAATPAILAQASAAAERTWSALESHPGDIALVARVGQDLSRFDLRYSHVGIVLRDHPQGSWTVIHQLNECGTGTSGIYAEGLLDFFLDGMVSYDSRIIWLKPELAASLTQVMRSTLPTRLHDPDYNVIARFGSRRTQNSTAWVLALLGAALAGDEAVARTPDPQRGLARAADHGFEPSVLRIGYGERLMGGLFSANARFTDHPLAARLGGRYEVVSVRSIFEWLRAAGLVADEQTLGSAVRAD